MSEDKNTLYVCELVLCMMSALKAIWINRSPMNLSCVKIHTSVNNRLNVNGNNLVMLQAAIHGTHYTLHNILYSQSTSSRLHTESQSTPAPVYPAFGIYSRTVHRPKLFSKGYTKEKVQHHYNTHPVVCTHTVSQLSWKCHTHAGDHPCITIFYSTHSQFTHAKATYVQFHGISFSIQ